MQPSLGHWSSSLGFYDVERQAENDMRIVGTFMVALFLFGLCASVSGQETARTLELNENNYDTIRTALVSPKEESGWREIPWHPSLGEAIVEARKQKKPILLWLMNGHPCGMT